jgi:cation transport ATPase
MSPKVQVLSNRLILKDESLFRFENKPAVRTFILRAFSIDRVQLVALDYAGALAEIRFRVSPEDRSEFLGRLVNAVGGKTQPLADVELPDWTHENALSFQRTPEGIRVHVESGSLPAVVQTQKVPFAVANASLGLSTVGAFVLPAATPVAAGLLVATNLKAIGDAAKELTHGKLGVPMLQTALLTCSIVTGQVLAFALTEWSLRYWQKRSRQHLAQEGRALINETLELPELICVVETNGTVSSQHPNAIGNKAHIRLVAGEVIPFDGVILGGDALVDETIISGARGPVRKSKGALVNAGSLVLLGSLDVRVEDVTSANRADRVRHALIELTNGLYEDPTLRRKYIGMSDRTVPPTLATAGVGYLMGNLFTVGAILHQDWISGPEMAVPFVTLDHARKALRQGVVVRSATAIDRLSRSNFMIFDGDDPALSATALELSEIETRLPDKESVLQHVAGAGLYLGDGRAHALADACRERGLIVRQPELISLDEGQVSVRLGDQVVRLIDSPSTGSEPATIRVEINGQALAMLHFKSGRRLLAAEAVARVKALGYQTFLVSSESDSRAAAMARNLGVELSGGELDTDGRVRFVQGLIQRGVKPVYLGQLDSAGKIAAENLLTVTAGGFGEHAPAGEIVLMGDHYAAIADLAELSSRYESEIRKSTQKALIPNLLCVAGAFGGVLNGITSGIIANIGVMNVDRNITKISKSNRSDSRFKGTLKLL